MKRNALAATLLLVLCFLLIFVPKTNVVRASGSIYIRADGSVEGTTSIQTADNVTYVFTANINDSIVVERNNIVMDGNGHMLQGASSGTGIDLSRRTNVTVKNTQIKAFECGIRLSASSSYNNISGNKITWNGCGIYFSSSPHNTIYGNEITANCGYGIELYNSSNTNIYGNEITANIAFLARGGWGLGIYLVISSNNNIFGNNITNNYYGMWLDSSSNNMIYCNNFIDNYKQVNIQTPCSNVWDDGLKGNYWSNYNGTGSTPYIIDANNQDTHPLITLYGGQKEPTSLVPAITITAVVGVVGVTLLVYFGKVKKRTQNNETAETQRETFHAAL